ncbi:MAG: 50S ribosomal protein L6, partial [Hyphomicrobiales bacterium]|nr:50S ribosomal protein L6 [Hyphomicrobiales bacterium]MCY4049251.1 50S ribosomal protein L6 [Hyphomicrobiales bacterium]
MSRIGKKPVPVPEGVEVRVNGNVVEAKGKNGSGSLELLDSVTLEQGEGELRLAPRDDSMRSRSMWGMQRTLLDNLLVGVSSGFSKTLLLNGVGYRAEMRGKELRMQLGFSHDILYPVPEGIEIKCPRPVEIIVSGRDRQRVGQVAANLRAYRPPEPYKGKGVRYSDE